MTILPRLRLAGGILAAGLMLSASQIAYANGQGTPVEAPPPMQPAATPEPMAPVSEPMTVPNWSGFYVGGSVGYGFLANGDNETLLFDRDLNGSFGDTVTTTTGANAFSPGFCDGKNLTNSAAGGCTQDDDGGVDLGVRAGFDWQSGNFVYGGLVEATYVDIEDSITGFSTTPAAYKFTRDLSFLGAARLRAGFASGNFLFYATGGVAYGDIQHAFATTNGMNSFTARDDNGSWGYQVGGGAEVMLSSNISLGAEYLYTSLDDNDYTVRVGAGTALPTNPFLLGGAGGTDMVRSEDQLNIHQVRAVVNFRFGGM